LEYIDDNLNEQIGYEHVAQACHFSPYHFHRMFTIIVGQTITAYIRGRRIERAAVMLADTKKSSLDICFECGFDAYSSFSRVFKSKYGLSPNVYRKQAHTPVFMSIEELMTRFKEKLEGGTMSEKIMKEIEELNKKIELEPDNANNLRTRGELYMYLCDYEKSIADYTKTMELIRESAWDFYGRGLAYQNIGDFQRSIDDFTKAIELDSDNAVFFNGRGVSYRSVSQDEKAIADFTKAIELEPNNADHYYQRSTPYHKLGEYEKAISDFTKTVELQKNNGGAYIERAYCYYLAGKNQEMISDCTKAIEIEPSYAYSYIERGCAYWLIGEREKTLADFIKAVELDSQNKCYLEELEKEFKGTDGDEFGYYQGCGTIFFLWEIIDPRKV